MQNKTIFFLFFAGGGRDLQTAVTYAKNSSHNNKNSLLLSSATSSTLSSSTASASTTKTMAQSANTKINTGKLQPAQQIQQKSSLPQQQQQSQKLPSLSQLQAGMNPSASGFDALKQQTMSQSRFICLIWFLESCLSSKPF